MPTNNSSHPGMRVVWDNDPPGMRVRWDNGSSADYRDALVATTPGIGISQPTGYMTTFTASDGSSVTVDQIVEMTRTILQYRLRIEQLESELSRLQQATGLRPAPPPMSLEELMRDPAHILRTGRTSIQDLMRAPINPAAPNSAIPRRSARPAISDTEPEDL